MRVVLSRSSIRGRLAAASLFFVTLAAAPGCAAPEDPEALASTDEALVNAHFVAGQPSFGGWCAFPGDVLGEGDFDGNGKTDFYCHEGPGGGGRTWIALASGTGFVDGHAWLTGWCTHPGATVGVADVDGNGKTDLFCHDVTTNSANGGNLWVAISTGSGFVPREERMVGWCQQPGELFGTGDFDGNHQTDFYCRDQYGVTRVILSKGSHYEDFGTLNGWCTHAGATMATGDFDGNGMTDFYCHDFAVGANSGTTWVALSWGYGFTTSAPWMSGWCSHTGAAFGTGDFNGDGKTDFSCHDWQGTGYSGNTWVTFSTGAGVTGGGLWLSGWCAQPGQTFGSADFDGNGLSDVYCHDPIGTGSAGTTYVALSTGVSFVDRSAWLGGWCSHTGASFGLGDFNGDRKADLFCHDQYSNGNAANTWVAFSRP
jgi:hypothetical protein